MYNIGIMWAHVATTMWSVTWALSRGRCHVILSIDVMSKNPIYRECFISPNSADSGKLGFYCNTILLSCKIKLSNSS